MENLITYNGNYGMYYKFKKLKSNLSDLHPLPFFFSFILFVTYFQSHFTRISSHTFQLIIIKTINRATYYVIKIFPTSLL